MLKRLLILIFLVSTLAGQAEAQTLTVREFYVRELRQDGYETIRISRTLLGRLRFVGTQPGRRRELVVNPANGAILRDYVRLTDAHDTEDGSKPPYPGGGGYDDDGDDDDDYDDDSDEDDDDDEDDSDDDESDDDSDDDDDDDD